MSTPARLVDVADAVAAKLRADWNPAAPDGVERTWLARLNLGAVDDGVTLLTGRRVFVMPAEPSLSVLARGYWLNGYTVAVLYAERYTDANDPTGAGLDAWLDDRVKWWQDRILYPLASPNLILVGPGGVVSEVRPDPETPPEVTAFVDRDILAELNALMIAVNFRFIDGSDHTGAS